MSKYQTCSDCPQTKGEHNINLKVVDLLKGNEGPPPKFDPPREGTFKISVQ